MNTVLNLYRCMNCPGPVRGRAGRDFFAHPEHVVCPDCGADLSHPQTGRLIQELALIHFDPPGELAKEFESLRGTVGENVPACDPTIPFGTAHLSGETRAVTCPRCKATDAFREATGAELSPKFNIPIQMTAAGDLQLAENPDGLKIAQPPPAVVRKIMQRYTAGE